eukprot:351732-Chlamydomonas_euryale.AAC.3
MELARCGVCLAECGEVAKRQRQRQLHKRARRAVYGRMRPAAEVANQAARACPFRWRLERAGWR